MTGTGANRGLLRGIKSPELRLVVKRCMSEGWEVKMDGGTHLRVRNPDGRIARVSTTVNGHGINNVLSALRRAGAPQTAR